MNARFLYSAVQLYAPNTFFHYKIPLIRALRVLYELHKSDGKFQPRALQVTRLSPYFTTTL